MNNAEKMDRRTFLYKLEEIGKDLQSKGKAFDSPVLEDYSKLIFRANKELRKAWGLVDLSSRCTYRDVVNEYFKKSIDEGHWGGVIGCPSDYFYHVLDCRCKASCAVETCKMCWGSLYRGEPIRDVPLYDSGL